DVPSRSPVGASPGRLLGCAMLRAVFASLLSGLVGACGGPAVASAGSPGSATGAAPSSADAAFARFVDDYFEAGNRYSPTEAVGAGFHAYDAQIEDRSRARIE